MTITQKNMIFVAPYTPQGNNEHLGAAQKIETLISIFSEIGFHVNLVDSSHHLCASSPSVRNEQRDVGGTRISYWRPSTYKSRKLGKLLNLLETIPLSRSLVENLSPSFVWTYNGYAFESKLAMQIIKNSNARAILEIEDLPLARSRGLNPKPLIDALYFRSFVRRAHRFTAVNSSIIQRYKFPSNCSLLLPSIIDSDFESQDDRIPFSSNERIVVGYFGGLSSEKGLDVFLESATRSNSDIEYWICGAGPLAQACRDAALKYPKSIKFFGKVDRTRLVELMCMSDAIVNPHRSLESHDNGIFPFKVCEAIASGALLVSTPLPTALNNTLDAVLTFDGSHQDLTAKLTAAKDFYLANQTRVRMLRLSVLNHFGRSSIADQISKLIHQ